ncbi:MAG: Rab family GTPase [Candidatus Lokiarchaeota archaeon]|jgi:GTPase SAR1 family protein
MIFDYENKILQVKVVYYGPAMSGKTTSIKYLFSYFNKGDTLKSIDSSVGRTLFFDFGVLNFQGADWSLKFLIYSATGQDFYASTRPATLNGVDGLIFVVDSRLTHFQRNIRSWNELRSLFGDQIYEIPIVVSLNKYDLNDDLKTDKNIFLRTIDLSRFRYISLNKTIALKGHGVLDAFNVLVNFIFPQLTINMSLTN